MGIADHHGDRFATIVSLVARRLDVPMKKPFGIAGGAQTEAKNILVEIVLAGGTRGWGEGAPFPAFNGETQADALTACEAAAPLLLDRRSSRCDEDDDVVLGEHIADACRASPSARCAIETAIFDARARRMGVSLPVFFNNFESPSIERPHPAPTPLQELVTDITITTGTIDEAVNEAIAFAAFSTLKIKVGGRPGANPNGDKSADVQHDIERVRAVRSARPNARLLVDANGGFSVDEALRFAEAIKDVGIVLFEQPVAASIEDGGGWRALAEVRQCCQRLGLRIGLDESITRASDVDEAIRHGAADAINVKIMKSGIFEALKIIARTRAAGVDQMIGGMVETRLAMGMSACIAAGIGGFTIIDLDTPLFLADDPIVGGYVQQGERIDLRPIVLGHGATPRDDSTT